MRAGASVLLVAENNADLAQLPDADTLELVARSLVAGGHRLEVMVSLIRVAVAARDAVRNARLVVRMGKGTPQDVDAFVEHLRESLIAAQKELAEWPGILDSVSQLIDGAVTALDAP